MDSEYCYGNIAVGSSIEDIRGYYVIRIWRSQVDKPDIICETMSVTNTELVSDALNATIGLTSDQAGDLLKEWIGKDIE